MLGRVRWLVRQVRPLEWVLLAFLFAVTAKVGLSAALEGVAQFAEDRARELFLGLLVVVTLQQVARAFTAPWKDPLHPLRAKLLVLLPVALFPFLVGLGTGSFDEELWQRLLGPLDAFAILKLMLVVLQICGVGAPTMLLWLGAWDFCRREGRFELAPFASGAARSVVALARDWVPLLMLLSGYAWIGAVMDLSVQQGVDGALRQADLWLFRGTDPVEALERIISRPLSEWMAFAYSLYAVFYALVPSVVLLRGGREALRALFFPLGTAMALTWFSYLVFPAKGPVLSRTFSVSLDLYYIEPIKEALMDAGRITYDCFPSMHTCATLVFWYYTWRSARWLFWLMAPVALSIPFSCVYLRYHYVVDVIAGVALAAAVVLLEKKLGSAAPSERAATSA